MVGGSGRGAGGVICTYEELSGGRWRATVTVADDFGERWARVDGRSKGMAEGMARALVRGQVADGDAGLAAALAEEDGDRVELSEEEEEHASAMLDPNRIRPSTFVVEQLADGSWRATATLGARAVTAHGPSSYAAQCMALALLRRGEQGG